MTSIDAIGTGLMLPMSALYFTRGVGLSAISVGAGLSIAGVVGLAATPLTGPLVERFSARSVLISCYLTSAAAFAAYPLVRSFAGFLAVVSVAAVSNRITQPARIALGRALAGSDEASVGLLATVATVRNAGFGLGGLLTSAALASGRREGYIAIALANSVSYLITAVGLRGLGEAATVRGGSRSRRIYRELVREHRDYITLAALNAILLLYDSVLVVGVPLWITRHTHAPVALAGLLFTLNTALVVGLQIRVSQSAASVGGAARSYARSGAMSLAACLVLAMAGWAATGLAIALLIVGAACLTAGELSASAAEWGASIALAPEVNRGYFLGIFGIGTAAQLAGGPVLVTYAIVEGSWAGWLALGSLLLVAGVAAKRVTRTRARALTTSPGQPHEPDRSDHDGNNDRVQRTLPGGR